jgi:hypothetical protein
MVAIQVGAIMVLLVRIVFDGEPARFLGTLVIVKCAPTDHFICSLAELMYSIIASP